MKFFVKTLYCEIFVPFKFRIIRFFSCQIGNQFDVKFTFLSNSLVLHISPLIKHFPNKVKYQFSQITHKFYHIFTRFSVSLTSVFKLHFHKNLSHFSSILLKYFHMFRGLKAESTA